MSKIFSFNRKSNGLYIDSISKGVLSGSKGEFKKTSKGYAWEGNGIDSELGFINISTNDFLGLYGSITLVSAFKITKIPTISKGGSLFLKGSTTNSWGIQVQNSGGILQITGGIRGNTVKITTSNILLNKWYLVVLELNEANSQMYINNEGQGVVDLSGHGYSATSDRITSFSHDILAGTGEFIEGDLLYNSIYSGTLTTKERNDLYIDFLRNKGTGSSPFKKDFPNKPTDLGFDDKVKAAYRFTEGVNDTDITNNGYLATGTANFLTKNGKKYNGTNSKSVIGNLGNIYGFSCRIKLSSTSEKIIEGAANDKMVFANAGTLSYAEFDNAYVDGVDSNTISADTWVSLSITSSTVVDFSACTLALNNATYGEFEIADLRFHTREWTAAEMVQYHNDFIRTVIDVDYRQDAVGIFPRNFDRGPGTFTVQESDGTDGLDIGTKFLQCDSVGNCAIQSKTAYGEWEFDIYNKGTLSIRFISADTLGITNLYLVTFYSDGRLRLRKDGTNLISKLAGYLSLNTHYRIKVTRTKSGLFTVYIKGGTFGNNDWTTVGSVIENTYTESNYIVLYSSVVGGSVGKFKVQNEIRQ